MAKKKRLVCAVCGEKMNYAYTSVLYKGKVEKVCNEICFKKAFNDNGDESINGRCINRSIGFYNHR